MKKNSKNSQFSSFLLRSGYAILVKIGNSSFCSIYQETASESYLYSNLIILTDFHSFTGMKANIKISQFSRFLLRSGYPIQVKIWKWLKLLNSAPFIRKPLVKQVCIWIWSFWLTFTVLQWMKKNSKNSQFSSFLLRSGYTIFVQIWKWLKLLNSYRFVKKQLLNLVYIRIWSSWLTFTVSQGMKANIKISQFSRFLLRSEYLIQVKIWKWLTLLNSVPFIKKPLVNQVCIWIWSFWLTFTVLQWMKKDSKNSQFSSFLLWSGYAILVKIGNSSFCSIHQETASESYLYSNLIILTDFHSFTGMKANIKISQFSRFLLRSEYPIQVKIWKWLKLLNSAPFIRKPLVNQVCIWIWSFWLTFTVLQWMKKNSKNSQFSSFLLRSGYTIFVQIWKWLKLLNSYRFIKKRLLNLVYIRIWSSSLTFTVSQGMKANIKISQFSRFLLRSEYLIQVKIWKWLKLLNSVPFIKKPLVNQVCIWIWSFWLTFTVLQWMKKNSKNSQFSSFLLRSGYAILVKIWKWLKLLNSVPFIKKPLVNQVCIWIW